MKDEKFMLTPKVKAILMVSSMVNSDNKLFRIKLAQEILRLMHGWDDSPKKEKRHAK